MKNRNGFTLIELLAVIVILAIIALIATPIILNVIDTARKGAKESSALGYIDAIEKHLMLAEVDSTSTKLTAGTYSVSQLKAANVDAKGETPDDTGIVVINTKGAIEQAWFTFEEGKYKVYYDGSKAVASTGNDYLDSSNTPHNEIPEAGGSNNGGGSNTPVHSGPTLVAAGENDTHKGIVYLDPTNLSTTCNQENSVSTTGTKSGCMKFYIIKDNGDSVDMILDHNTTAKVAWNSNGSNASIGEVATALTTDTTGWSGSPRLITANEIASITGNTGFDSATAKHSQWFHLDSNNQTQTATSAGASRYAWLFDYTNGCTSYGCNIADSSTHGYWTSSSVSASSNRAWSVYYYGGLFSDIVDYVNHCGVRPVITINKSSIN